MNKVKLISAEGTPYEVKYSEIYFQVDQDAAKKS